MSQRVVTEATAADGKAMTVAELRDFLAQIDPDGKGTVVELRPRVKMAWGGAAGGTIKSIKVTEER